MHTAHAVKVMPRVTGVVTEWKTGKQRLVNVMMTGCFLMLRVNGLV